MSSSEPPVTPPRTRWGRSRFGGGSGLLIAVSLLLGAVLSCGVGWLLATLGAGQARPWLGFVIGAVVTLPVSAMLTWVVLVDRSTIKGATRDPENSIEDTWFSDAATGTLGDLMAVLGLGIAVFVLTSFEVATSLVLAVIFVLGSVDFAVRYLVARRSGS